jgi:O-antigen/teichoic acid export membrane protein
MKQSLQKRVSSYFRRLQGKGVGAVLVRGAGAVFVLNTLGACLGFGVQILLAQLLGVDSYGNYIYPFAWIHLLALGGKLGLDTATLRFVSAYHGRDEWGLLRGFLRFSHKFTLIFSLFFASGTAVIIWLMRDRLDQELTATFWVACLLLPSAVMLEMRSSALQALKRMVLARAPQTVLRPLLLAGGLFFAIVGLGQTPHASLAMTVYLIGTLAILVLVNRSFRSVLSKPLSVAKPQYQSREWIRVALPLLLTAGLNQINNRTDILMIGAILGTTKAGIYAAVSRIVNLVLFGISSVNAIAAPMISQLYAQGRTTELQRVVTLAASGIAFFSIPVGLGLVMWGKSVLALFGPAFSEGYTVLVILIAGKLVNGLTGSVGYLMLMTGHQQKAVGVMAGSAF